MGELILEKSGVYIRIVLSTTCTSKCCQILAPANCKSVAAEPQAKLISQRSPQISTADIDMPQSWARRGRKAWDYSIF